jgi:hypothetical protein
VEVHALHGTSPKNYISGFFEIYHAHGLSSRLAPIPSIILL